MNMKMHLAAFLLVSVCLACSSAPVETKPPRKISNASPEEVMETFPTVELTEGKLAEDRSQGVMYWNAENREASRIEIREGRVYNANGKLVANTRSKQENQIGYVMDQDGAFYIFNGYANPSLRHSSVFAGKDVAGAGDLVIEKGKIVYIDASSEHYRTKPLFKNVLIRLRQLGVPTGKCVRRQVVECRPGSTDPKEN